jgi:hypothetical protein
MSMAAVAALLLAGCAASGVAHLVPAYPTAAQPPDVVERDKSACDQAAMQRPDSVAYQSACLIAKGYRTYVPVVIDKSIQAQFSVRAQRQQDVRQALKDISECAAVAGGHVDVGPGGGFALESMRAAEVALGVAERPFIDCMVRRSYAAGRWAP